MSIKDYNRKLVLVNSTTNESIKIPQFDYYNEIETKMNINDYLLLTFLKDELDNNNMVTIAYSYMKD